MKRMGLFAMTCSAAIFAIACDRGPDTDANRTAGAAAESPATTGGGLLGGDNPADFVERAAQKNMAEIQLSELAADQAQNPQVKQFAQKMVDEHTKALNELRQVAQRENIPMPTAVGDDVRDRQESLSGKRGAEFDREYMDAMVDDHNDVLELLEDKADDAKDKPTGTSGVGDQDAEDAQRDRINRELSQWAAKTVPSVRHHLEEAKQIQERVNDQAERTDEPNRTQPNRDEQPRRK